MHEQAGARAYIASLASGHEGRKGSYGKRYAELIAGQGPSVDNDRIVTHPLLWPLFFGSAGIRSFVPAIRDRGARRAGKVKDGAVAPPQGNP